MSRESRVQLEKSTSDHTPPSPQRRDALTKLLQMKNSHILLVKKITVQSEAVKGHCIYRGVTTIVHRLHVNAPSPTYQLSMH